MVNIRLHKLFFIFLFCIIFSLKTYGLILSHPEQQQMKVSENGIFFSGKIGKYEKVYINNLLIQPEKYGAFSYSFPLNEGENIFDIKTKNLFFPKKTIKYNICRVNTTYKKEYNQFKKNQARYQITKRDNVVLRSTPIDKGMNRMGYLPKGTKIYVDGTTNEFSRVYLSKNNYGWVMTKDINPISCRETKENNSEYKPIKILLTDQIKTEQGTTYTITLSDNCPYSAVINKNKLVLTVYNTDNFNETFKKEFDLTKFPRYSVTMRDCALCVNIKNPPLINSSNKKFKIVIDAGHGGEEFGAIGCLGDKEKNINLKVARKLEKILKKHKFEVVMTRKTDKYLSLNDRVELAKDADALIFISIHLNSVPISSDPNLSEGSVVFYFNPQSEKLAKILSNSLSQTIETKNGGTIQASYAVIRPTEYIGVLAELAYLVNPKDVAIYKNRKFPANSAQALYKGLVEYINSERK